MKINFARTSNTLKTVNKYKETSTTISNLMNKITTKEYPKRYDQRHQCDSFLFMMIKIIK